MPMQPNMNSRDVKRPLAPAPETRVVPGVSTPLPNEEDGTSGAGVDCLSFDLGSQTWLRSRSDHPQAVIDALVAQTSRQGAIIHNLTEEVSRLREENLKLANEVLDRPLLSGL